MMDTSKLLSSIKDMNFESIHQHLQQLVDTGLIQKYDIKYHLFGSEIVNIDVSVTLFQPIDHMVCKLEWVNIPQQKKDLNKAYEEAMKVI